MGLLAFPVLVLFAVAAFWGFVRMVREVGAAANIGAQLRTFGLVILLAVVIELVAPIAVLHGQKIYGWSLFFDLMIGWFTVALVVGAAFQIACRTSKKESFRAAVSAVLMTPGVLLLCWVTVGRFLLTSFGVVTST